MSRGLGTPRTDLIDLLTSPLGAMAARRIDEVRPSTPEARSYDGAMARVAERLASLVRKMNRDQLESCDDALNAFFGAAPFALAIPVAVEIELKWPHHIETLPEANRRLEFVRKAAQYAVLFNAERIAGVLSAVSKREARG